MMEIVCLLDDQNVASKCVISLLDISICIVINMGINIKRTKL